ncbi:hypothetical protein [Brachybacterium sp. FME24]|uniref:hypothetical protein n=1 Tax=Brachybacterium sp. FME24 TaxID=2742605 RepID=UPI001868BCE3|nr:hypothetical protein [Brachybacterium sp. FME24]
MSDPTPLEMVRARFPLAPDQDEAGLRAQAEHLADLRRHVDRERLRDAQPAMTFDPRNGTA